MRRTAVLLMLWVLALAAPQTHQSWAQEKKAEHVIVCADKSAIPNQDDFTDQKEHKKQGAPAA